MRNYDKNKKIIKSAYPKSWDTDDFFNRYPVKVHEYRNLTHFTNTMKKWAPTMDTSDYSADFEEGLDALIKRRPTIKQADYENVFNRVKNSMIKRGLISESISEEYQYHYEGEILDVSKLAALDPKCMLTKNTKYDSFFYEITINASYPHTVGTDEIKANIATILATIQLLEREHKYCKINIASTSLGCNMAQDESILLFVPLFSHNEFKNIETMSSVINNHFLRSFTFLSQDVEFGPENVEGGRGRATRIPNVINLYDVGEEELIAEILNQIIEPVN